jgi:hypothetical protein
MHELFAKWKKFVSDMNAKGVPVPMIRDSKTGSGSVSLTLVFLSFNIWIVSIVGKWSGQLGGINPTETLNMFMVCAGLYFGRKLQKDPKGNISVDLPESEQEDLKK